MNNSMIKKVNEYISEMYKFKDPSIKKMLQEVGSSKIPLPVKVELVTKLSHASDKISGKWTNASQLMKKKRY